MNFTLLQWNVWYKEDPENIVRQIKKIGPDIVCAQELVTDRRQNLDTASFIAKKLGYHYYYQPAESWSDHPSRETQGNAIFSRFPLKPAAHTYLQTPKHDPDSAKEEGRVYIEAQVNINATQITVATTHLSFSPKFELTPLRQTEAKNLIKVLAQKQPPYIFAGDLNTTPTSSIIKNIETNLVNAGPDYRQNTWTTKPFSYDGFEESEVAWRLDYVFTSPDIKVVKSEILTTPYSDHLPVYAEFSI